MNSASTAKVMLQRHYSIADPLAIPTQRIKSEWKEDNKFGFLCGILEHGEQQHREELVRLSSGGGFAEHEDVFIDQMFDHYIRPYLKSYSGSSCHTPVGSRPGSAGSSGSEPTHRQMKKALEARDGVCLFCWGNLQCQASHIVARKNVPFSQDEYSLLQRAGLQSKHQVQNGLYLCSNCHGEFDLLHYYVDVVDDRLVLKIVNQTNDPKDVDFINAIEMVQIIRLVRKKVLNDNREIIDADGEMRLWFMDNNADIQPNRAAVQFHKTACLIWRMAGGADPEDEYCSDCDSDTGVDYLQKERLQRLWDSAGTLRYDQHAD
ncbi:hypothetical protein EDD86DRAFT_261023 [Gorgonomyces haynaldii]|nr:hypothetical protein EDD86DRAFT_261023 [Gorgonomyces haynaldii]